MYLVGYLKTEFCHETARFSDDFYLPLAIFIHNLLHTKIDALTSNGASIGTYCSPLNVENSIRIHQYWSHFAMI